MAGGLDDGKVLRVVGMAATMRLTDRGPDDAINRRISLLVLNQQAEQAILHENAESQNESLDDLKQPGPSLRLPFQHRHQPIRGDSVSMDISDFTRHSLMKPTNCWPIWSNTCSIWCEAPDSEQLNAIFRAAHSIKGGAGTFGFTILQETTHLMENLLDEARRGEMQLNTDIINLFWKRKILCRNSSTPIKVRQSLMPPALNTSATRCVS